MEELHLMSERDPSAKAIVFSQFVAFLDLLEHRISRAGEPHAAKDTRVCR